MNGIDRMDNNMTTSRSVHLDKVNGKFMGVCSGIANYFGWDANLLRIVFVVVSILSAAFPGILVYLILWLLMPEGND